MENGGLDGFFESFLKKESIFLEKTALQASYSPETITHREEQINQIANILAPSLKLEKPSNLFLYGKTGSGKTMCVRHVIDKLQKTAATAKLPLKTIYINCKLRRGADTEYRLIAQLARELGKNIPATGLPTEEVYRIFFDSVNEERQVLVVVLDEIDQLIKKTGDNILYTLTRANEESSTSEVAVVGISNDLTFIDNVDPRVRSSLSEEELIFPPYNALQLQDILRNRSTKAFKNSTITPGVIEKCAAYAAREHGDARRALELLRVAGELAERNGAVQVTISHVDNAEDKIDKDRILDVVSSQPKQHQLTLYSILNLSPQRKSNIFTGEVYEVYRKLCSKVGMRPLTQRRLSDIIGEFDMFGIINAKVISKGRYGRTREIGLSIPENTIPKISKILEDSLGIS